MRAESGTIDVRGHQKLPVGVLMDIGFLACAAGLSLVPELFHQPGGGGAALLVLGLIVIVPTCGRLGLPRKEAGPSA